MKHPVRHRAEAVLARGAIALLRRLDPAVASDLGGWLARRIGPWLPVSRIADINLRHALPELDAAERQRIIGGVWDNLGRTAAELPHLARLGRSASGPGWEVEGEDILRAVLASDGPAIMFGGHIGGWEALPGIVAACGTACAGFYRAAANPLVDELINAERLRVAGVEGLFPKGSKGARAAMLHLAQGGRLGILVDQKMNEGIEATLFGHPAMTATAPAALALRFRCPLLPGRALRIGPARFRLVVEPPLALPASGDLHADIASLTQAMNDCLERWIREWPEGWLWLHRRFPQEVYRR
jgi:KDO2-lipid IV(A) lauroyltransferase